MKTLFLVRHAKTINLFNAASDFNRTLTEKGKNDAEEMAKRLVKQNILIDQFVSSPAVRALSTAEIFVRIYNRKPDEIRLISELYQASSRQMEDVVSGLDDQYDRVALFAHNPGISDYASSLDSSRLLHMPTCAIFAVTTEVKSWQDFPLAGKTFLFFDSPKAVQG